MPDVMESDYLTRCIVRVRLSIIVILQLCTLKYGFVNVAHVSNKTRRAHRFDERSDHAGRARADHGVGVEAGHRGVRGDGVENVLDARLVEGSDLRQWQADKLDPYAVQVLDAIASDKRCWRGAPSTRARVY